MSSKLNQAQVIQDVHDLASHTLKVMNIGGTLTPEAFDSYDIVYVLVGNGIGEPATVTYKLGGVTTSVLTFTYNASNKITSVVKT